MSFIAKNPLILPETNKSLSVPHGTKGLAMTPDGLVIVDSNAKAHKIATKEYVDSAIGSGGGAGIDQDTLDALNDILEMQEIWFTNQTEIKEVD